MGIKSGIILGFLVGAGVAAWLRAARRVEAPGIDAQAPERPPEGAPTPAALSGAQQSLRAALDSVRKRANEALAAAHEAADEKETELRRRFQSLTDRP